MGLTTEKESAAPKKTARVGFDWIGDDGYRSANVIPSAHIDVWDRETEETFEINLKELSSEDCLKLTGYAVKVLIVNAISTLKPANPLEFAEQQWEKIKKGKFLQGRGANKKGGAGIDVEVYAEALQIVQAKRKAPVTEEQALEWASKIDALPAKEQKERLGKLEADKVFKATLLDVQRKRAAQEAKGDTNQLDLLSLV